MIEVRYLDRVKVAKKRYHKLVEHYAKGLEHPVVIVFDKRIKDDGEYFYDADNKRHFIRLSPKSLYSKELIILITLHELKHAHQWNKLRRAFYYNDFCKEKGRKRKMDPAEADYDSKCETEARDFAMDHLDEALALYESCI